MNIQELVNRYLEYVGASEAPAVYHRWSFLSVVSASLSRRVWFPMGHFNVYPNLYVILMGDPGARKNTAINISKDLLKRSGFSLFAGTQVTREKFYMDLDAAGELSLHSISQQFICAPEFNNFIGIGQSAFITALTQLYDAESEFEAKYKNSKTNTIPNPCVGILAGNTQQGFSEAFPPSILHNGFLSRLLLIWGQRSGQKLPWLPTPDEGEREFFGNHLSKIKEEISGQLSITPEAKNALQEIYHKWDELEDGRFVTYGQRRYIHLLKLCITCAAGTGKIVIEYSDILYANTLLTSAELYFTRAIGEFGKARNANEASIVMNALYSAQGKPLELAQLWKIVQTNLEKFDHLRDILVALTTSGKAVHSDGHYWSAPLKRRSFAHVDFRLLGAREAQEIEAEMVKSLTGMPTSGKKDDGEIQL